MLYLSSHISFFFLLPHYTFTLPLPLTSPLTLAEQASAASYIAFWLYFVNFTFVLPTYPSVLLVIMITGRWLLQFPLLRLFPFTLFIYLNLFWLLTFVTRPLPALLYLFGFTAVADVPFCHLLLIRLHLTLFDYVWFCSDCCRIYLLCVDTFVVFVTLHL